MAILTHASILTAYSPSTIGSKVVDREGFETLVCRGIESHDTSKDRAPGQHFIKLPAEACPLVSAGVGHRTANPEDYVLRVHRGRVSEFLKREKAAAVEGCAVVVYTAEAYLSDPDVAGDEAEVERVKAAGATHVLIAVLAFAGPQSPLTPYRLAHNLAGGNKEAATWSPEEIREKAAQSKSYWDEWATVAD